MNRFDASRLLLLRYLINLMLRQLKFSKQPCFAKRRVKFGAIKNSAKSASETAFLRTVLNLAAKA